MRFLSWLFCVTVLSAFVCCDAVQGQCRDSQKSLLLRLHKDFSTTYWGTKLKSWDASKDCCGWSGVTCTDGYVTSLDLSGEGIDGSLNDTSPLFELKNLTSLNLAQNLFGTSSTIPPSFAKLGNLMHLNLSRTEFSGQIPIEISYLKRLVTLDISSTFFFGLKVDNPNLRMLVGNLSNLVELQLDSVDLSTQSSDWCQVLSSSLPHLQVLKLSNSGLSGPIHPSLQNLKSLSVVDLNGNSFRAPFPNFFSNFRNLTYLDLADCSIGGKFSEKIFKVQTLRYLDLSENHQLQGNFPVSLQQTSLETLLLQKTLFSKTIPESIGQLRMLLRLDISGCYLVGSIPKSISQLTHLVSLDMSSNSLNGSVPSFSQAKNLKELDLSYNEFSGSLLSTDWKQLSKIESVQFQSNSLTGSLPTALFGIRTLQQAYFSRNRFTGFTQEPVRVSSSQLKRLYLNGNELQGQFPSFIFGLQGLEDLDLSLNNFGASVEFNSLRQLTDISYLVLSHSNLSVGMSQESLFFPQLRSLGLASCKLKAIPGFLKNHSHIEDFDLSENDIQGQIPSWIWDIDSLSSLSLSHNHLESIGTTKSIPGIESMDLSSNWLHGELPFLPALKSLDISANRFNSSIASVIHEFGSGLSFLNISGSNLFGGVPESMCATSLYSLDLSDNFLSGSIPECLLNVENIHQINIRKNNFSGIVPDAFPSKCVLEKLDFSANSLQGNIPKTLRNCTALVYLDFSHNDFEKPIPNELGYFETMQALNISHNRLSGPIPISFGNLTKLEALDLAKNELSGTIPKQLASLKLLTFLNVSYNQLSGRIPNGPQFRNFSEASFEGNKGLCGFPLKNKC